MAVVLGPLSKGEEGHDEGRRLVNLDEAFGKKDNEWNVKKSHRAKEDGYPGHLRLHERVDGGGPVRDQCYSQFGTR